MWETRMQLWKFSHRVGLYLRLSLWAIRSVTVSRQRACAPTNPALTRLATWLCRKRSMGLGEMRRGKRGIDKKENMRRSWRSFPRTTEVEARYAGKDKIEGREKWETWVNKEELAGDATSSWDCVIYFRSLTSMFFHREVHQGMGRQWIHSESAPSPSLNRSLSLSHTHIFISPRMTRHWLEERSICISLPVSLNSHADSRDSECVCLCVWVRLCVCWCWMNMHRDWICTC